MLKISSQKEGFSVFVCQNDTFQLNINQFKPPQWLPRNCHCSHNRHRDGHELKNPNPPHTSMCCANGREHNGKSRGGTDCFIPQKNPIASGNFSLQHCGHLEDPREGDEEAAQNFGGLKGWNIPGRLLADTRGDGVLCHILLLAAPSKVQFCTNKLQALSQVLPKKPLSGSAKKINRVTTVQAPGFRIKKSVVSSPYRALFVQPECLHLHYFTLALLIRICPLHKRMLPSQHLEKALVRNIHLYFTL